MLPQKHLLKYTDFCISIVLISIGFWMYHYAFNNEFLHWDDQYYITENPLLQNPSWENLQLLLSKIISNNYHPLTMLSFWINAAQSGIDNAYPFIVTNVSIHICNGILVYFLLKEILEENLWIPIFAAILFIIHPMHLESVIWVSERKDVLYSFFFLCSLIFYSRFIVFKKYSFWFLSFLFFICSCLSKAMAVSLVPCLLLIDFIQQKSIFSLKQLVNKIPFLLIGFLIGIIAIDVQAGGDFFGLLKPSLITSAISQNDSFGSRIIYMLYAHHYYISQFLFPFTFSAFHPYSMTEDIPIALVILTTMSSIGICVWSLRKQKKVIVFGIMFYVFTICLVLQLLPVGSALVAERYTYLPYIGLTIILGYFIQQLWNAPIRFAAPIVTCLCILNCIVQTLDYGRVWQNHNSLFEHAMKTYPSDGHIRTILANGYWHEGQINQAIEQLEYTIDSLHYEQRNTYELLGNCYADIDQTDLAIKYLDAAIDLDPHNAITRYHRGLALLDQHPQLAIEDFNYCERSGNDYVKTLLYAPRGRAYGMINDYEKSISDLTQAIAYFPDDPYNYADRSITYQRMGKEELSSLDRMRYESLIAKAGQTYN